MASLQNFLLKIARGTRIKVTAKNWDHIDF